MTEDYISIDEDFPYSNVTNEQLIAKIKELSNKLVDIEDIENITKLIYYSEIALSEMHHRQLLEQTRLFQSQITLLQSQLTIAQTSIENSEKEAKSARKFAIWALVVSGFFGLFGIFDALNYAGVYWQTNEQYDRQIYKTLEQQSLIQDSILKSVQKSHIDKNVYYPDHNNNYKSKKTSDKKQ